MTAMNTPDLAAKLVQTHRAHMRNLWADKPKPSGGNFDADDDKRNSVLRALRKQQAHLEALQGALPLVTCLRTATRVANMQKRLRGSITELPPCTASQRKHRHRNLHRCAVDNEPYETRAYTRPMHDIHHGLLAHLPPKPSLRNAATSAHSSHVRQGVEVNTCTVHDILIPSSYTPITDAMFRASFVTWTAADTATRGEPPMNPGQRNAAGAAYRSITYRAIARNRGDSAVAIYEHMRSEKYSLQTLITGMGGAGKSEIILQ